MVIPLGFVMVEHKMCGCRELMDEHMLLKKNDVLSWMTIHA